MHRAKSSRPIQDADPALSRLAKELKPYLRGWCGYFCFCQTRGRLRTWKRGSADDNACISSGNGGTAQPLQGTAPS
ncbi:MULTISPECIES: group II intron maturase-specific domain-containing protein [Mesorhizobium]|uniref:Group II intron maturase-specific domain-containing protein n=1 Tax=Mesorhizobium erdmanii TaxID=1777866 RepID=A0A6M7UT75_9HYPH|nr:hypothetical protein EB233_30070 [Mesorhizobium erdmanii]